MIVDARMQHPTPSFMAQPWPRKALNGLDAAPLEPEAKALFLGGNAVRVVKLDRGA